MIRRGFTLLEVLLAIALIGLTATGLVSFLQSVATQRDRLGATLERERDADVLIERLERAVMSCVAGGGDMGSGLDIRPSELRIVSIDMGSEGVATLVTLEITGPESESTDAAEAILIPTAPEDAGETDPVMLRLTDGGGTLADSELPGIARVAFRAHDGGAWVDTFDVLDAGQLPPALEISLWYGESEGVPDRRRVIAIPGGAAE